MDGKIERRTRKDGTVAYSQRVEGPLDPETGKRQRVRVTADTEKELRTKSRKAVRELEDGLRVKKSGETFEAFATAWMESVIEPGGRPSTVDGYWVSLRNFVFPHIGHQAVQDIDYRMLQRMQKQLLAQKSRFGGTLANATVRIAMTLVRRILGRAVTMHVIARNPMDLVQLPRITRPPVKVWTSSEAITFLTAAQKDELEPYWSIAVLTGMRPGEIMGLRWAEIDLDAATLRVERTRTYTATGRQFEGPPKTDSSRRTIDLPSQLVDLLRPIRRARMEDALRLGKGWRPHEAHVVLRANGVPPHSSAVQAHFAKLLDQTGLPKMRLHGLRHVHASLMLQMGVSPKLVQERLGHATVSVTLAVYSHVLPSAHRAEAQRLGGALFGGGPDASREETDGGLSDAL